jgi:hypothetical protein
MLWILLLIPFLSPQDSLLIAHDLFVADSLYQRQLTDSIQQAQQFHDSVFMSSYRVQAHYNFMLSHPLISSDIQQLRQQEIPTLPRYLLLLPLLLIATSRLLYAKDFMLLWQSLMNRQAEQQQLRSGTFKLSLFSFMLYLNFALVMSMYVLLVSEKLQHKFYLQPLLSLTLMVFLFTFFLLQKNIITRLIGYVFNCEESAEEFLAIFFNVVKIVGISMFPAVLLFSFSSALFFTIMLWISFFVFFIVALYLVIRGLSTFYKYLYTGIYHSILYICIQEVTPLLLLIKLLTKTIH